MTQVLQVDADAKMPNFERNLRQTATYWASTGHDLFGKQAFATPVTLPVRWEDKVELIRDKTGEEIASKSRVFLATDIDIDGYLFLGTSVAADPTQVNGAEEVRQLVSTPDLRNLKTLYVAYL